jgi:hypothetical protein
MLVVDVRFGSSRTFLFLGGEKRFNTEFPESTEVRREENGVIYTRGSLNEAFRAEIPS